jgi:hypothetical protein
MPTPTSDDDSVPFSRNGLDNPMGKLLDELKTKVDPDTALMFRKAVHEAGTDAAGALRDWVYLVAHGKTFTDICLDAAKVKRTKLFGTGPNEALPKTVKEV